MPPQSFLAAILVTGAAALLAGCSANTQALADAVRQSMRPPAADTAVLNPQFSYLRLTNGKNVSLLVLGYVEDTPRPGTEVWYSGEKETIRLWRGRLAGSAGLPTDWRWVRFDDDLPGWRDTLAAGTARYRRQHDLMPGYAVGIREQVLIRPIAAPRTSALAGLPADSLQWFEEHAEPEGRAPSLPAARFAVDLSGGRERLVYSEQCLSADLCLTLQAWPVGGAGPAGS